MRGKLVTLLAALVLLAGLAAETVAVPMVNKVVGVGVDDSGRPWVAGSFDINSDRAADRWQMTRYTSSGAEDTGFNPDPVGHFLDIVGGGGVDHSSTGFNGHPWMMGARDTTGDGVREDFAARRYDPATGADELGFQIDHPVLGAPYGSLTRGGGVHNDNTVNGNDPWIVGARRDDLPNRPGQGTVTRHNTETGEAIFGFLLLDENLNDDWVSYQGVGAGNLVGQPVSSSMPYLFVTGTLTNGKEVMRIYDITSTGARIGDWELDFGADRFLDARGVGVDPRNGQPWAVGAFDSNTDGQRDGFASRRYDPGTGTENLGFLLSSSLGDILDVDGIGVDPDGRPWYVVLLDVNGNGSPDRWAIQRYSLTSGLPEVDSLIDSRFTFVPEPASLLLLAAGGLMLCRRRSR